MIQAKKRSCTLITNLLVSSFASNKSVLAMTGGSRQKIRHLMRYCFEKCFSSGKVFHSPDLQCVALVLFPDKACFSLLDIGYVFDMGVRLALQAMRREKKVKALQPSPPLYYLWFIGVKPDAQGKGKGSAMMQYLLEDAKKEGRTLVLETSTERNFSFYEGMGFKKYNSLEQPGYVLHFYKQT